MIEVRKAAEGALRQQIELGARRWYSDVSAALGGEGADPDPHDLLDSALGACTALTVMMVARRRQMPLQDVRVRLRHEERDGVYRLEREVELLGPLDAAQRETLLGIANKCPIHKALLGHFEISTRLKD